MTDAARFRDNANRTDRGRGGPLFALIVFPLGHLANDWPGAALWLLAPAIALSLDLSTAEVGLLITLHGAGASLGYLPAGIVGDRVRNRGALLAVTFWWVAAGYFAASFFTDFWTLALLLAFAGLGDAAWHPIAAAAMVEQTPNRRARAIGVHAFGGILAEVGAPLCAGILLAYLDWQTVLRLSVIPAATMAVLFIWLSARVSSPARPKASHGELRSLMRSWLEPASLVLIAIISLYNMSLMGALAMMPLFLQRVHDYTSAGAGAMLAAAYLLGALSQPAFGHASDVLGRKGVSIGTLVAAALLFVGVTHLNDAVWSGVTLATAIGLLTGIRSVLLAAMLDRAGRRESTTLGFGFSIMDGVGALGALFAGMAGAVDMHHAFLFTAGAAAAATGLAWRHAFAADHS